MASGMPDYLQQVRPNYGGVETIADHHNPPADELTELLIVFGRGMVYGGYVHLECASTQRLSQVHYYIDDVLISQASFKNMNDTCKVLPLTYPKVLGRYNDVLYRYSVYFSYGYTFEKSIKIAYLELESAIPSVYSRLIYALI